MSIIEDFIESEKASMTRLDRKFRNYPVVRTTGSYTVPAGKYKFGQDMTIRPSIGIRAFTLVFLSLLFFMWFTIVKSGLIFPLAFVTFMIVYVGRNAFFNKRYNYSISVSASGISIDKSNYPWERIAETCIMSKQNGKYTNNYLIIFDKDGSTNKYDLRNFGISKVRLAKIIEYYKNQPRAGSDGVFPIV